MTETTEETDSVVRNYKEELAKLLEKTELVDPEKQRIEKPEKKLKATKKVAYKTLIETQHAENPVNPLPKVSGRDSIFAAKKAIKDGRGEDDHSDEDGFDFPS
ncbi:MAG: hypothetical protein ACRCXC_09785 [Legionella sp.]